MISSLTCMLMLGKFCIATLAVTLLVAGLLEHRSANAVTVELSTDKDEVSLGQDLTIILEEPDANIDSRTVDKIPLNKVSLITDKFDKTPLDQVLEMTGIEASQSYLRETGPNTGIFEVTLESINSKLADRNTEIDIIYFDDTASGGGSTIRLEKSVSVVPATIAIAFDKKQYSLDDEAKIELVAQLFNVDRYKVDVLTGKVAVTTTSGQTYFPTMNETGVNTGVFVGKVELTADQREKRGDLLVKSGDDITARVVIVPRFEVADSSRIYAPPASVLQPESITVSTPQVLDQNGDGVSGVRVGANTTIQSTITNSKATKQSFALIIHVIDADGSTSQLSFVIATLDPNQSITVGRQWTPPMKGVYTVEVFTWDNLIQPSILSPVKNTMITVK